MRKLRVLITNNALGLRGGSELYVRDVATALLARGHTPIVYSRELGEVARELRAATIPVVDDLSALGAPPDVIHGQHHLETVTALLHFPAVPALYVCHGWVPWAEAPPRFARIRRYVAVDHTCRDRLVLEHGVPEDRVRLLLNFVDLDRFQARAPLPSRPRRALVFSNGASEHTYLPVVREACARAGLEVDVMGFGADAASAAPEAVLGRYDVVFARGRSALEALAVGAAVVLCDTAGVGPMVTAADFDRLRVLNFGVRNLRQPLTADVLVAEIARYDAADAAAVSRRIRSEAGRAAVVDELVALYEEVIAEHAGTVRDAAEEQRSLAAYLHWLVPFVKEHVGASLVRAYGRTLEEYRVAGVQARGERDHATASLQQSDAARTELRRELERVSAELGTLREERARLLAERADLEGRCAAMRAERDGLASELAILQGSTTVRARDRILSIPLFGSLTRALLRLAKAGRRTPIAIHRAP